jgi:hypothetical protein
MIIECDACAVRGLECGDCVVTVLLGAPPARGILTTEVDETVGLIDRVEPVDLDAREREAIAVLARHGLIPPLRLVARDEDEPDEVAEPSARRRAAG